MATAAQKRNAASFAVKPGDQSHSFSPANVARTALGTLQNPCATHPVHNIIMPFSIRARLSIMMFLNYVIWGAWYVTLSTYLTNELNFTGTQGGAVFGTTALASMISLFFVGV